MTAKEFYERHIGKAVDIDGAFGVQCVDLFKAFTKENYGVWQYNCTNGYASGLWTYRKDKPYYKYFVDGNINSLQNGDWVIWGNCKIAPSTHVAMYYNGKFLGQNQNGKRYATCINLTKQGVIGVLRPRIYIPKQPATNKRTYINLPPKYDSWAVYNVNAKPLKINAKGRLNPKKFGGLSYYVYAFRDNGATAEIQTSSFGRVKIYVKNTPAILTIGNYKYKAGTH